MSFGKTQLAFTAVGLDTLFQFAKLSSPSTEANVRTRTSMRLKPFNKGVTKLNQTLTSLLLLDCQANTIYIIQITAPPLSH